MTMTVTEYKERVHNLKENAVSRLPRSGNPAIAIVTINTFMDKFINMMRAILELCGFTVHWYNYTGDEGYNNQTEIEDIIKSDYYKEVYKFIDNKLDEKVADWANRIIMELLEQETKITVLGQDSTLAARLMDTKKLFSMIPFGVVQNHIPYIKYADVTVIIDPNYRVYAGYVDFTKFIQLFSWSTIEA